MDRLRSTLDRLDRISYRGLARLGVRLRPSIAALRVSIGVVFLLFGLLKFVPGLSPAERLATDTVAALTFGLLSGWPAGVFAGALETAIGLIMLSGRYLHLGLVLLAGAMVGVLSPLVLFPGRLFVGVAPTLAGQYVLKDIVLLAATVVVAAGAIAGSAGRNAGREEPTAGGRRRVATG